MRNDYESNYLEHHGILGQKWGVRRFQNADGSLTEAGKKRMSIGDHIKEHKKKKQRKAALEKARIARQKKAEEKRRQEEWEKKKEDILRSDDPKTILKYKRQMSDNEIQGALNRVRNVEELSKKAHANEKTGFEKIDDLMGKAKTVGDWVKTGSEVYDNFASVYNTFIAEDEESRLPTFKGGGDKKKKKKDKDDD